jgi:hypothetical protein
MNWRRMRAAVSGYELIDSVAGYTIEMSSGIIDL